MVNSDLFIRALLLGRILVTEKTTRTPRVHLVKLYFCGVVWGGGARVCESGVGAGGGGNILIHKLLLFKLHTYNTNQVIISLSLFFFGGGGVRGRHNRMNKCDDLEFTTPCWSATSSLLYFNQF